MCGRLTLTTPAEVIAEVFGVTRMPPLAPRYNIAPTQALGVVRAQGARRTFDLLRWGLVPRWAGEPTARNRMINARAETLDERPAYREAFAKRRCLVVADGYYEWQHAGRSKQPYWVHRRDCAPFALAGLWETWRGGAEPLETCAIVTTAAADFLADIHDRMPLVVAPEHFSLWLDPSISDTARLASVLTPRGDCSFETSRVGPFVNDVRNDDERCTAPQVDLFARASYEARPKP